MMLPGAPLGPMIPTLEDHTENKGDDDCGDLPGLPTHLNMGPPPPVTTAQVDFFVGRLALGKKDDARGSDIESNTQGVVMKRPARHNA